jgi:DNA-directed RNA polymerase subunit F
MLFSCIIEYMMTRNTMTNTQTLALAYAEKLVAYYETKSREAYAEMVNAQNALAYSAECEATE